MKKALLPSLHMADEPALALGNTVVAAFTGSTIFTTPSPSVVIVQAAVDTYAAALAAAQFGSRDQRAQKNAAKQNLLIMLRQWCDYVNTIAQGDMTALSPSGFRISKDPGPRTLGTPELNIQNGASGELISSTPAVQGGIVYKHQYTTQPAAELWPEVVTTKATCKIAGLEPGTIYNCRIVVIGTNNQVTMSNVITKMVA